ncbi:MAG: zinc ribbon domain-containing protein [Planctomycetia bacterium]|nr:zinc ribbon domain-containing protein [Planctomycetia bacterium]
MPTYDYKCSACDHMWELFQSIKAEPEKKCPECGKKKAQRLIGAGAGLIFKGSGFYITDYRSKSYADAAKADTSSSAPSKTESSSKSESSSTKSESSSSKSSDSSGTKSKSSE